jgi:hypothetical protein
MIKYILFFILLIIFNFSIYLILFLHLIKVYEIHHINKKNYLNNLLHFINAIIQVLFLFNVSFNINNNNILMNYSS